MSGTFFISSSGSMATAWLARVLDSSARIKCFHGAVDLLPKELISSPNLGVVFNALAKVAVADRLWAGAVHLGSAHGVTALEKAVSKNAVFVALVRNPIAATNSQYTEKTRMEGALPTARGWAATGPFSQSFGDVTEEEALFLRCATSVVKHYLECATLPDRLVFRFETYTNTYAEIQRLLASISRGQIAEDADVEAAFNQLGVINSHHGRSVTWESIYRSHWTDRQRVIFNAVYQHYVKPLIGHPRFVERYPEFAETCRSSSSAATGR